MKKYLATFICRNYPETGLIPLMFLAIITVNFDLNKRVLEAKNDDEIRAINREILASNNVKSFLPMRKTRIRNTNCCTEKFSGWGKAIKTVICRVSVTVAGAVLSG